MVLRKFPNIQLLLIGDGEIKNKLLDLSKDYGLQEKIIFTGMLDHKDIPLYIGSSEICFAPFSKERNKRMGSSAFKIYEYASCERPIITTHPDFVTKNNCGLVSRADNPLDLSKKTLTLLSNPQLAKKMGENGRKAIINSYSWKNVADKINKIFILYK